MKKEYVSKKAFFISLVFLGGLIWWVIFLSVYTFTAGNTLLELGEFVLNNESQYGFVDIDVPFHNDTFDIKRDNKYYGRLTMVKPEDSYPRISFNAPEDRSVDCMRLKEEPFNITINSGLESVGCLIKEMEFLHPKDTQRLMREYNLTVIGQWDIDGSTQ